MMSDNIRQVLKITNRAWVMRRKGEGLFGLPYYWIQVDGEYKPTVERLNNRIDKISWALGWLGVVGLFVAGIGSITILVWVGGVVFLLGRLLPKVRFRYLVTEKESIELEDKETHQVIKKGS